MKVFLSSTYLDLTEHRKAVVNALRTMGEKVEHMEIFGALDKEPTKASLEELDKCDVLVGVYAYRYGTVPKGTKTSVTEQEYLHAEKKKLPILVFVVNESHPWLPKLMDKSQAKINSFKSRASDNHTPAYFTTPDNLASQVVAAIGKLGKKKKTPKKTSRSRKSTKKVEIRGVKDGVRGSTLPNQPYFFGREKELREIEEALSPESRTWGALIDGPGGIGKTALAIRAAHLAPNDLFERKIFITAKVRELTPEGEKPLKDFSQDNYFSMLNELALELGEETIPRLAPEERANPLRMAIAGKKVLIIFDNLETLREDERGRLFHFLSRLPEGNKAIATSRRRRPDIDARAIRLIRLEQVEALQLVEKLAETNPRLARENKTEYQKLYEMTNGNPLLIKWTCGQLGRDGSAMRTIAQAYNFINKAPVGNDPLEYIFGDLLETFTKSETKALAALTHFTEPAKFKWIMDMTSLGEGTAKTALEDLSDRSVLISNDEKQEYYLPSLAAEFIRKKRLRTVNQTGKKLSDHALALALQYGYHNYEGFETLDNEWHFIVASWYQIALEDSKRLFVLRTLLHQFLNFTGRWDDEILLNQMTEQKAIDNKDDHEAGLSAFYSGYAYFLRGQAEKVLECAKRAKKYWKKANPREQATAIRLHGLGHQLRNELAVSKTAFNEALAIYQNINPEMKEVIVLLNDLAIIHRRLKNYKSAEINFRKALNIAKNNNDDEQIAGITDNLAELAIHRGQWDKVEALAIESLTLSEKIGRLDFIATSSYHLSQTYFRKKQFRKALPYARRAVEIFTRLRLYHDLNAAQNILSNCENATQTNKKKVHRKPKRTQKSIVK
ncbi:MAG: DUF4062 domain-containing protein [Anaerolineales bacterium]|nr:DUF4062 domain-containing protein [Anaerolineales bacterium]